MIKLPPKIRKRGRPKGAELTAIGLSQKKSKKESKPIPFSKMSPHAKDRGRLYVISHTAIIINNIDMFSLVMLQWFVNNQRFVDEALTRNRLIRAEELITDAEKIPVKCLDECITLSRIRKYFKSNAWEFILKMVEKVKEKSNWYCQVCCSDIDDAESIGCDTCLEWYHIKCSGLSQRPKKKNWICRNCYKTYKQ